MLHLDKAEGCREKPGQGQDRGGQGDRAGQQGRGKPCPYHDTNWQADPWCGRGPLAGTLAVQGETAMENKEALAPVLVQEFVARAHGDLKRVQELLEQEPKLANAAWDWGGGDWETGLGAAAHMGRKDIALYLLEKGARMDIFAAAMLGKVEVVQAMLRAFPEMRQQRGPHGIPLLDHARAGGEEAAEVVAWLQTHGNSQGS
jgi:hypothetical protein